MPITPWAAHSVEVAVIARNALAGFWADRPETKVSLERWYKLVRATHWAPTDKVCKAPPRAKVLNRERVRFEIAGGSYRLVAAFDFSPADSVCEIHRHTCRI